uniref:Uncharacterized protein n=1 Tax=Romanomermis culicivorax TaxID=13658 RepID=A0A915JPA0_ROMCU
MKANGGSVLALLTQPRLKLAVVEIVRYLQWATAESLVDLLKDLEVTASNELPVVENPFLQKVTGVPSFTSVIFSCKVTTSIEFASVENPSTKKSRKYASLHQG